jgi:LysM repeat protein
MSRPLAALSLLPLLVAAGLPHARGTCGETYTVMRGDTLYSIARLCRSSVRTIARTNGLANPANIEVGQRLALSGRAPSPSVAAFEGGKDEPAPPREALNYPIARGDTLYSLARWAGVSLRALLGANPGVDPARIEIGDLIRLPGNARDPIPTRMRERGRRAAPTPRPEPAPASDDDDKPEDGDEPDPAGM